MSERTVRVDPDAEEEFEAAIAWYDKQVPGLGDEFWLAVDETLAKLQTDPLPSTPVPGTKPELGIRRLFVSRFPYQVVFIEHDNEARVIAIAHLRRKPGYWRNRIG